MGIMWRENWKGTTPLQVRRITKALEGRMCPSKEEVIRRWKNVHRDNQAAIRNRDLSVCR